MPTALRPVRRGHSEFLRTQRLKTHTDLRVAAFGREFRFLYSSKKPACSLEQRGSLEKDRKKESTQKVFLFRKQWTMFSWLTVRMARRCVLSRAIQFACSSPAGKASTM